jgi:dephospho-CoA kinase
MESMIRVWGLTGLMGSGKSAALAILKGRGHPVLDADEVSRWVVDPTREEGREGLIAVRANFGDAVIAPDGGLDRAGLRKIISADPHARVRLEKLLHPRILQRMEREIAAWAAQGHKLGFVEGVRLIESGYLDRLAGLIVVQSEAASRLGRVRVRDGLTDHEIEALMATQDGAFMARHATVVWNNDGALQELEAQVDAFLRQEAAR